MAAREKAALVVIGICGILFFFAAAYAATATPGATSGSVNCRAQYDACKAQVAPGGTTLQDCVNQWRQFCMPRKCPATAGQCNRDAECQAHCVELVTGTIGQTATVNCCSSLVGPEGSVAQSCRQVIQGPGGLSCVSDTACPTGGTGPNCPPPPSGAAPPPPPQQTPPPTVPPPPGEAYPGEGLDLADDAAGQPWRAATLERLITENLERMAATLPPPVVIEGTFGAHSTFDNLFRTGQLSPSQLSSYITPGSTFSLDTFLAPPSASYPGDTYYEGARNLIQPVGTFNPIGAANPFVLPSYGPSGLTFGAAPPPSFAQSVGNIASSIATGAQAAAQAAVRAVQTALGLTPPPVVPTPMPPPTNSLTTLAALPDQTGFQTAATLSESDIVEPGPPSLTDQDVQNQLLHLAAGTSDQPDITGNNPLAGAREASDGPNVQDLATKTGGVDELLHQYRITSNPGGADPYSVTVPPDGSCGAQCIVYANLPTALEGKGTAGPLGFAVNLGEVGGIGSTDEMGNAFSETGGPFTLNPKDSLFTNAVLDGPKGDNLVLVQDGPPNNVQLGDAGVSRPCNPPECVVMAPPGYVPPSPPQSTGFDPPPADDRGPDPLLPPGVDLSREAPDLVRYVEGMSAPGSVSDSFPEEATELPREVREQQEYDGARRRLATEEARVLEARRTLYSEQQNDYPLRNMWDSARCATGIGNCTGVPAAEAALADAQRARDAAAAEVQRLLDLPHYELARLQDQVDRNLDEIALDLSRIMPPSEQWARQIGGEMALVFGDQPPPPDTGVRVVAVRQVFAGIAWDSAAWNAGGDSMEWSSPPPPPDEPPPRQDPTPDQPPPPPRQDPAPDTDRTVRRQPGGTDRTVTQPPPPNRTTNTGLGAGLGFGAGAQGGALGGIGQILQGLAQLMGAGQPQQQQPPPQQPPMVLQPPPTTSPPPGTPNPLRPAIGVTTPTIKPGEQAKIIWNASRATSCTLTQGTNTLHTGIATDSFTTPTLQTTTSYTLSCTGDQGTATTNVTVYVGQQPPASAPKQTSQPAPTIGAGGGGTTAADPNWCDPAWPINQFVACLEKLQ